MCDYASSSQFHKWLYGSPDILSRCRRRANFNARKALSNMNKNSTTDSNGNTTTSTKVLKPTPSSTVLSHVECYARGYYKRRREKLNDNTTDNDDDSIGEESKEYDKNEKGHPYLTPEEECLLVSYYASRLPPLIGPYAQHRRLQRECKVTATACMLFRRFFLSNSVMLHDPKAMTAAAAFLGAKIEDAMTDVRYLEEATKQMDAPVSKEEILPAELSLLTGIDFDCLCFHPYKVVVALTEDLRTYLKSDKGKDLIIDKSNADSNDANGKNKKDKKNDPSASQDNTTNDNTTNSADDKNKNMDSTDGGKKSKTSKSPASSASFDLLPIYDTARQLVDGIIFSDIPLLYSPGQIGLAALMVANESQTKKINIMGYVRDRFHKLALEQQKEQEQSKKNSSGGSSNNNASNNSSKTKLIIEELEKNVQELCVMIRSLKNSDSESEKYGFLNDINMDLKKLKAANKKLKKVRAWGFQEKKDKKRSKEESADGADDSGNPSKRAKTS